MTKLAPGFHADVPMELYHSDCCAGPSVSGSDLLRIEQRCPAVAFAQWGCNPDRIEESDTAATLVGRAFHTLILEGQPAFDRQFAVKPEGMSLATADGKAWKRDQVGKAILSHDDGMRIFAMSRAVSRDSLTSKAFDNGAPEVTAIVKDPATGIFLKSRPDWLRSDTHLCINLKTSISAKPADWERQAFSLGYHIGAALAIDVVGELRRHPAAHVFVIVEKEPPYCAVTCLLKPDVIEWGRLQYRKALDTFARCIESGHWPGYADQVIEVGLPRWAEYALEERHGRGEFETRTPETLTELA